MLLYYIILHILVFPRSKTLVNWIYILMWTYSHDSHDPMQTFAREMTRNWHRLLLRDQGVWLLYNVKIVTTITDISHIFMLQKKNGMLTAELYDSCHDRFVAAASIVKDVSLPSLGIWKKSFWKWQLNWSYIKPLFRCSHALIISDYIFSCFIL